MHINKKTEYAIRAMLEIASRSEHRYNLTRDQLSEELSIPRRYLGTILSDLKKGGLIKSLRGPDGGYQLANSPDSIYLADVIRVIDGALTQVGGLRPEALNYGGSSVKLGDVWLSIRRAERDILESTSLKDLLP